MPIFCNAQTTAESLMKKRTTGDSAQAQTWITKIVRNTALFAATIYLPRKT